VSKRYKKLFVYKKTGLVLARMIVIFVFVVIYIMFEMYIF